MRSLLVSLARTLAGLALCSLAATAAHSAALVLNGNILMGATGVNVDGSFYSVSFVDGTCAAVHGSCEASAFTFKTQASAMDASVALLNQVFTGQYDDIPTLTNGCQTTTIGLCQARTAYDVDAVNYFAGLALNDVDEAFDGGGVLAGSLAFSDTSVGTGGAASVWAVWTLERTSTDLPEPGSILLVGLALLALACSRRARA